MNQNRPDIFIVMLGLSKVYKEELTDPLIDIWIATLEDLSEEEIKSAAKQYLRKGNPFFPKPGQIYQLARPVVDYETEAMLVAEEIVQLLGPCGANDSERAMARLSEKGRAYIELVGGWYKFASNMQRVSEEDMGMLKSQMRKAIKGIVQRKMNVSLQIENGARDLKSLGIEMKGLE